MIVVGRDKDSAKFVAWTICALKMDRPDACL